jgi:hypothetical protein
MLPEVVLPGQNPAVLYPDDLLVHEGLGLFPAGLKHRLAARRVPAVPGGIFGNGLSHSGRDEPVVKLGPLRAVIPCRALGCRPILVPGQRNAAGGVNRVVTVNRVTVAEIETGRKQGSVASLRALAVALDVTLDDLTE